MTAVLTLSISVSAAIRPDGLDLLSSLVTVGALVGFLFLHAAVIGYFVCGRRTSHRAAHIVIPVIGGLIIATVLALAAHPALVVAGIWLAIGLAALAVRERTAG